jgi:GT2 family glycosyltransferase
MVAPALTSRMDPTEEQNEPVKLKACRGYSSVSIHEDSNKAIYNVDFLSGCALLVDLDVFEDIGLFNEQFFLYVEDLDLCIRAKNSGWQLLYHDGTTVEHEGTPRGELSAYYGTRNRLYLISNHLTGWCFLTAVYWFLAFRIVFCGYWTLKNRLGNVRGTLMGLHAFLQGEVGKR